jgi:hypothetical protein
VNYSKIPPCLSVIVAKKIKPYVKKYVFNDKHIDYFKTENDAFFENHKTIKSLYNADFLRITIGQRPTNVPTNANIFLILDDSDDDTSDSDDDNAYDNDADTEDDNNMDTEDDAADTIQYEYNYEYNYHN